MSQPQNEFDFHRDRSFLSKLQSTFLLVVVGIFFFIFTAVVFQQKDPPLWLLLFKYALEVSWMFWVLALLHVWFDWAWLRALYRHGEKSFMHLVIIAKWTLPVVFVAAIGFVWYLIHTGVLPVKPK